MNTLLIIVFILLVGGVLKGSKTGFIKEATGAVRLLFAVVLMILIIIAVRSYLDHDPARCALSAIAIGVVSLVYKVVNYLVSFFELLRKLPLIKELDKVAGGILGAVEALFLVWAFMVAIPMLNIGELTSFMETSISSDVLLKYISRYNYLEILLSLLF